MAKDIRTLVSTNLIGVLLPLVLAGVASTVPAVVPADGGGDLALFLDDFEATAPGTLPPGWTPVWTGAGLAEQRVSDDYAVSGSNSFRLLGTPGWSSVYQRNISLTESRIGYQFEILIDGVGASGEEHPAFFSLATGETWGAYFAMVRFDHVTGLILAEDGTTLGAWAPQTWYTVRAVLDRPAGTYDVWLDGNPVGTGLPIIAPGPDLIESLALVSAHAGVPVYYDDVTVFVPQSDIDGDGIPDAADGCPTVNPGLIDLNLDGCTDTNLVIATYLDEETDPLVLDLPPAAVVEIDEAIADLQIEVSPDPLVHMLEAVQILEVDGTTAAADAAYTTGLSAQTAALLAVEEAELFLGPDDPNVIAANTLAEVGIEQLGNLLIPEAVQNFLDAVLTLDDEPRPAILVEVDDRSTFEFDWVKYDKTFAAWGEYIWIPIRVTNTGNVPLADVRVNQTWSDFSEDVGVLGVGESKVLNVGSIVDGAYYRPSQPDPDPFYMVTTGVGRYGGEWVLNGATTEVDIIHPRIKVEISAPKSAKPGDLISIEVTVTNVGDVTLRDVWYVGRRPLRDWAVIGDMAPGESWSQYYHYLVPNRQQRFIRFSAVAFGGRDFDVGISWEIFGRRISDSAYKRMRLVRE